MTDPMPWYVFASYVVVFTAIAALVLTIVAAVLYDVITKRNPAAIIGVCGFVFLVCLITVMVWELESGRKRGREVPEADQIVAYRKAQEAYQASLAGKKALPAEKPACCPCKGFFNEGGR